MPARNRVPARLERHETRNRWRLNALNVRVHSVRGAGFHDQRELGSLESAACAGADPLPGMRYWPGFLVGFLAKSLLDRNSPYDMIFRILVPSVPAVRASRLACSANCMAPFTA